MCKEPWGGSRDLVLLCCPDLSFSICNMGVLPIPDLLKFPEVSRLSVWD